MFALSNLRKALEANGVKRSNLEKQLLKTILTVLQRKKMLDAFYGAPRLSQSTIFVLSIPKSSSSASASSSSAGPARQ